MNELVFIHELDSVRSSASEIKRGREVLLKEIVCNGNVPVLAFNQLADSKALLQIVMESDEMLEGMGSLMKAGRIRVSRFKDKRTASQYLQENLDPASNSGFLLSGWDLPCEKRTGRKTNLRDTIYYALKNNDPNLLDQHVVKVGSRISPDSFESENRDILLCEQDVVDRLKRLIKFILYISQQEHAYNEIGGVSLGLRQVIRRIKGILDDRTIKEEHAEAIEDAARIIDAVDYYLAIRIGWSINFDDAPKWDLGKVESCAMEANSIEGVLKEGDENKRAQWYRGISRLTHSGAGVFSNLSAKDNAAKLAYAVVDLSYNMVIEASVKDIPLHFDPCDEAGVKPEIEKRLNGYLMDYELYGHNFEAFVDEEGVEGAVGDSDCSESGHLDYVENYQVGWLSRLI